MKHDDLLGGLVRALEAELIHGARIYWDEDVYSQGYRIMVRVPWKGHTLDANLVIDRMQLEMQRDPSPFFASLRRAHFGHA